MGESLPDNSQFSDDTESEWRAVFEASQGGLRAFLRGRLGQEADVDDCLQAIFVKMIQQSRRTDSSVAPVARRSWLFRVASNEAALVWRTRAVRGRMIEKQGLELEASDSLYPDAIEKVIITETTVKIRQAIQQLPEHYRVVVQMRIDQDKTFQAIADELEIPLGTALTRMRRAMERLRSEIDFE
jgi:RNA polymerase sigma-70 factor (ECF subfamily)